MQKRKLPFAWAGACAFELSGEKRLTRFSRLARAAVLSVVVATAANLHAEKTVGLPDIADIRADNVHDLRLVFSFRLAHVGVESAAPTGRGGLLLVLSPFPHTLYAIDLIAADHRVRWRYVPSANRVADGLSCCDRFAHGPVVADGHVFFTTLDGRVVALDADTGAVRFDVQVADPSRGETLAGAPLVAEGRVFVGSAGDDFGARGWIAALDYESGRTLWKKYSTGPDADVGIGNDFKPFYAALRGGDLGTATWPPSAWQQGGGSVAGSLMYDARAHVVLHGTGHPAPWNTDQRAGDNRWTSGMFARDSASGSAQWFTGFNAHNPYAFRDAGIDLAVDQRWNGQVRGLVVHPDANGMLYVLDRASGEILSANSVAGKVVSNVDPATGETRYSASKAIKAGVQTRSVCPAWTGAFGAGASMVTDGGLVVLPLSRVCMDIETRPVSYIKGTPYTGANVRLKLDQAESGGVVAWSIEARKPSWRVDEKWPVLGGTLTTGSGLVFYGTLDGAFKALDAHTGKLLWQFKAPSGILSQPTIFRASDGRQYVAVVAGTGRVQGMSRLEALDGRDDGAGFGLSGLLRGLPRDDDPAGTLLVFRLP